MEMNGLLTEKNFGLQMGAIADIVFGILRELKKELVHSL